MLLAIFIPTTKKDFTRHNTTTRHLKKVESSRSGIVNDMYIEDGLCVCVCGKEYVHKRSLNAHQKVCSVYIQQLESIQTKKKNTNPNVNPKLNLKMNKKRNRKTIVQNKK